MHRNILSDAMFNFILKNKILDILVTALILIPLLCICTVFPIKKLDNLFFQNYLNFTDTSVVNFVATNKGGRFCYFFCERKELVRYENNFFLIDIGDKPRNKKTSPIEIFVLGNNKKNNAYYKNNGKNKIFLPKESAREQLILLIISLYIYISGFIVVYVYYPSVFTSNNNAICLPTIINKKARVLLLTGIVIPVITFLSLPLYEFTDEFILQKKIDTGKLIELNQLFQQKRCFFACDKTTSFSYKGKVYFSSTSPLLFSSNENENKGFIYQSRGAEIIVPFRKKSVLYINIVIAVLMYILAIYLMLKFPRVAFFTNFKKC